MTEADTVDGFLGGRLAVRQPASGYRAGVDPVFLAAAVPARPGDTVLELGCGVGTATLCLGARVPGLDLIGVEIQGRYADLARENAAANGIALSVHHADLRDLPEEVRARSFDHVIMNPPYFDAARRTSAADPGRETALSDSGQAHWYETALRRLRPGGRLTLIQVPEQLPAVLAGLGTRASVVIHPLAPRRDRDASRVIVLARKGGRAGLRLAAPTVLHDGDRHGSDRPDYTAAATAVLRTGSAWPWATG